MTFLSTACVELEICFFSICVKNWLACGYIDTQEITSSWLETVTVLSSFDIREIKVVTVVRFQLVVPRSMTPQKSTNSMSIITWFITERYGVCEYDISKPGSNRVQSTNQPILISTIQHPKPPKPLLSTKSCN